MLHDTNLTQHVNFPTHDPGSHTLDLVITSTDSSLNPAVICANTQPSDHFPVFSYLNLSPNLPPPPQSYTYRRLNSIDHTSFLDDLKQSSLITNSPQLLNLLLDEYDTTLHSLLDKHAPSLPNDLLATVLLSHGSPNPIVLLVAPVVKPNLPTDPHIPLQTILS